MKSMFSKVAGVTKHENLLSLVSVLPSPTQWHYLHIRYCVSSRDGLAFKESLQILSIGITFYQTPESLSSWCGVLS